MQRFATVAMALMTGLGLAVSVVSVPLPAFSADSPAETVRILSALAMNLGTEQTGNITFPETLRGGPKSEKPLGYYKDKTSMAFRSPYAKQDGHIMGQFAFALHEFILSKGGGYDSYLKKALAMSSRMPANSKDPASQKAMEKIGGDLARQEAMDKVHVSFSDQKDFARKWWAEHSGEFKKTNGLMQDWWLNDSILDASNLWSLYLGIPNTEDKDKRSWSEHELDAIVHKR